MMHSNVEHQALQDAQVRERANYRGRKLRAESTRMPCPQCGAESEIRTSRMMSGTMRETLYACTDAECGFAGVVGAEWLRVTSLSAKPNPAVNIPLSSHLQRAMLRMVLDHADVVPHTPFYGDPVPVTGDLFADSAGP